MCLSVLREKSGLTQVEVANLLSVDPSSVRNWERGRSVPRLRADQFAELCRIYGCTIEQLSEAVAGDCT